MNVEIGTVTAQFLFWKYLFQIFNISSLQRLRLNKRITVEHPYIGGAYFLVQKWSKLGILLQIDANEIEMKKKSQFSDIAPRAYLWQCKGRK